MFLHQQQVVWEAGALGFLMMPLKRQYSALQSLEALKNRTRKKRSTEE